MKLKILNSIREYKKETILAPVFMILEVFTEVLIPLQMSKIIDVGIKNGDMPYIIKKGIILIILAALALLLGILSGRMAAIAGSGFAKNLRHDIFYKIQDFSFKNIDKFSTSSLVTRMTNDISNVQMAFMMSIRLFVRTIIMLIMSLIMIFTINPNISKIFIGVIPFLALAFYLIISNAYPYFVKSFKEYDVLNRKVQENVNASRVVKAYVREDFEIDKFSDTSNSIFRLFSKAEGFASLNSFVMQFTVYTVIILILIIGGKSIVFGNMQTGELTSVIVYSIQILMALMMISFVFVMLLISEAAINRISEILNEEPDMYNKEENIKTIDNGNISFENVYFSYSGNNGNLALKNINFNIKSGQTVGILGSTGSAKSTLVQLIPRLYDVTKGSVKVAGIDVRDYDMEVLRDNVAMVLQKNQLFSGTIEENIKWGNPDATLEDVIRVCKLAQADTFITNFTDGYQTKIDQGGNNVSGGQKQRLCIARALLKEPKILILDDSTSAVDTKTESLIKKAFFDQIPNTTKIIIAQRISSVEDADIVIVLEDGEINGIGTPSELLKNNTIYQEIYNSQVKGDEENE
ncbi:ABC transporter ATP-binding protein [Streptobacillus felis]|uniref:ABC transporter ATP-binding protein n=1 Tax=Streptobacillus felis TaxID=1384509 RepID=A0A7Z0PF49_9FUSO|nr:ABC transporter ATP-binding protein [Streptobacillus felis]NYV28123.1 ABC transporter ATP-binding protein [Streptobacillus felis]